jgi:hypothetical protein
MSLSQNYPTTRPTLTLDFAKAKRVDPRVTFTRASTATYFDASGTLRSAANNAPRIDFNPSTLAAQGLLIEEARTNSIRNNTMQGAVAGTPGTAPTNWIIPPSSNGLSREITGTGTQNGITYVDVRYSGTTTSAAATVIQPENVTSVVAATGQSWSASAWVAIVGGSTSNLSSLLLRISERTSVGGILTNTDTSITPTALMVRYVASRTMTNASTERVTNDIVFSYANGAAIDITLRIGLPQLEQGAFATSVIPTTTTALTRSADVASVNTLSPWYNATEGTLIGEFVLEGLRSVANQRILIFDDGTGNNVWGASAASANGMQGPVIVSGVLEAANTTPTTTYSANTLYKQALALELNNSVSAINGTVGTADTSVSVPSGLTTLRFAASNLGVTSNVWFRRVTYYPRRLSAAELAAITA